MVLYRRCLVADEAGRKLMEMEIIAARVRFALRCKKIKELQAAALAVEVIVIE
jgi:hypothetical protein